MRRTSPALAVAVLAGAGALLSAIEESPTTAPRAQALPELGTVLRPLPDGPAKTVADAACLSCHSADMIRQQRLTRKQWEANVTKMIGWGAVVPDDQKNALVDYLFQNFGPDNDRFEPVAARQPAR